MSDALIGKTLCHYRVVRLIGHGGMGAVYEGVDEKDGRRVAIKVMMVRLGEDKEASARFDREARIAARIEHPNVARVMDNGASGDVRFLAMEYVEGQTLASMLDEKSRISSSRALEIVRQTASGLQAALQCGAIHRDIKPENLMITPSGEVKIVDFGLAKTEQSADSFKTATGAVMGTPHYMSPEQAMGKPVDHRGDIYSLGATFYHMLTGRPPFSGANAFAILRRHIADEVRSIHAWNNTVPEPVCQIVYRMMAKRPDERFQTHGHLIKVLDDAIQGRKGPSMTMRVVEKNSPVAPLVSTESGGRRSMIRMGVIVLALVAGALGVHALLTTLRGAHESDDVPYERVHDDSASYAQGDPERGIPSPGQWKSETVPMLRDINKFITEQDKEADEFFTRRERMQP